MFIGPDFESRLRLAVISGSQFVARLTLRDIDELAGYVAAEANHCDDPKVQRALDAVHDRLAKLETTYPDQQLAPAVAKLATATPTAPKFTAKQGQYLAFIYCYTKIHRRPPAEADLQAYFGVSAPAVHQMIITPEARGLIGRGRISGQARSIRLRVSRAFA